MPPESQKTRPKQDSPPKLNSNEHQESENANVQVYILIKFVVSWTHIKSIEQAESQSLSLVVVVVVAVDAGSTSYPSSSSWTSKFQFGWQVEQET